MAVHVLSAMYYVGQFDGRFNQRAAPPVRGLGCRCNHRRAQGRGARGGEGGRGREGERERGREGEMEPHGQLALSSPWPTETETSSQPLRLGSSWQRCHDSASWSPRDMVIGEQGMPPGLLWRLRWRLR